MIIYGKAEVINLLCNHTRLHVLHQILHPTTKRPGQPQQVQRLRPVDVALALLEELDLAQAHAGLSGQFAL